MSPTKKPELLLPAGNLKKLKTAFEYGADAVYLGLPQFSLRAKTGFDLKTLKEGIIYAHKLKKKVYVTINIFAHNKHIKALPPYLKTLASLKPDAIILSDPGVLSMVKKYLPKTEIHLSTQANTLNYEAVKFWSKNGVKRIILGRETSLKDIKEIKKLAPKTQLEVFVHGAMCLSYSGRCYLSAWLNNRSGNLGECTQPCRWNYKMYIEEPLRPGELMPLEEDKNGTYILNSRDLRLIRYLPELLSAGITSFKIEGRTKSAYYLAMVTKCYRQAIEATIKNKNKKTLNSKLLELEKELEKIDNRGYTTGFMFEKTKTKEQQNFLSSKATSNWQLAGEIVEVKKDKKGLKIYFQAHNTLKAGEMAEIVTPGRQYSLKFPAIYSKKGEKIEEVHGGTADIYNFNLPAEYDIVKAGIIRIPLK